MSLSLTDTGNAKRFVRMFGETVRYYPKLRKWLVWDGRRWAEDERHRVIEFAKETASSIYEEAGDKATLSWAKQSENRPRLVAMVTLAQSESGIPVLPDDLDSDPWALNVINGTIDLKTGKLHPHKRTDLITKLAPVKFDPHARCPGFIEHGGQI